jgi:hypothetical protein
MSSTTSRKTYNRYEWVRPGMIDEDSKVVYATGQGHTRE